MEVTQGQIEQALTLMGTNELKALYDAFKESNVVTQQQIAGYSLPGGIQMQMTLIANPVATMAAIANLLRQRDPDTYGYRTTRTRASFS